MGMQLTITDAYVSASKCRDVTCFSLEDVEAAFMRVLPMRFHQEVECRCVFMCSLCVHVFELCVCLCGV